LPPFKRRSGGSCYLTNYLSHLFETYVSHELERGLQKKAHSSSSWKTKSGWKAALFKIKARVHEKYSNQNMAGTHGTNIAGGTFISGKLAQISWKITRYLLGK
jgi:hypothetical protein